MTFLCFRFILFPDFLLDESCNDFPAKGRRAATQLPFYFLRLIHQTPSKINTSFAPFTPSQKAAREKAPLPAAGRSAHFSAPKIMPAASRQGQKNFFVCRKTGNRPQAAYKNFFVERHPLTAAFRRFSKTGAKRATATESTTEAELLRNGAHLPF